ncbi:hypothetical protein B0T17DRAFT_511383 [Bombardia bombarda]|uniref:Uncharacterized protein n=1 Tax=Bombardia bombarda TaxID=252184 RepID=A0AA39TQ72_9PEZI|nr:hypothetical protein B0T17DRAFT_511383 [Bombardia bombarda]
MLDLVVGSRLRYSGLPLAQSRSRIEIRHRLPEEPVSSVEALSPARTGLGPRADRECSNTIACRRNKLRGRVGEGTDCGLTLRPQTSSLSADKCREEKPVNGV